MISYKYKFIFFHVPKAAGSSILSSFKTKLGKDVLINDQNKNIKIWLKNNTNVLWPNHIKPSVMRAYLGDEMFQSYFKFGFVRNPYDRLVSLYHYTKQKEEKIYSEKGIELPEFSKKIINSSSFQEWILSGEYGNSQYAFLSDKNEDLLLDFTGQTENLQTDISYICGYLNMPNIIISSKNKSVHNSFESYVTKDVANHINQTYHNDFVHFHYDKMHLTRTESKIQKLNPKATIQVIQLKQTNKWITIPEQGLLESGIKIHPNQFEEEDFEVILKITDQHSSKLNIIAEIPNKNAINKIVLLNIQHLNSGTSQNVLLKGGTKSHVKLVLGKSFNRVIRLRTRLHQEYESKNFYCGIDLKFRLED